MDTVWVHKTCLFFPDKIHNGQILFCSDVSAGHFQKLFRAFIMYVAFNHFDVYVCLYAYMLTATIATAIATGCFEHYTI